MIGQNSNRDFYVTFSKWKVWTYSILCWFIACIPLLPILIYLEAILSGRDALTLSVSIALLICGLIFALFAAIGTYFVRNLKSPASILTPKTFSGTKNFKKRNFAWTPNTVLYTIKANNIILANLDPNQSLAGKLWGGPKEAVVVYGPFSKQNREDVLAAIDRLSPYPVKRTTLWGATRRLGFHTGH